MELFTVVTGSSEESAHKLYDLMTIELASIHKHSRDIELVLRIEEGFTEIIGIAAHKKNKESLERLQLVYDKAGRAIAHFIQQEYEDGMIRNLITKLHNYSDTIELESIEKYCFLALTQSETRINKLAEETQSYLFEHQYLILNGYVRFRLQSYTSDLCDIIEYAVDEYLMDKQYQEFISLLKYFVYIQEAKIPLAHVIHKGNHDFIVLNEQMKLMETSQLDCALEEFIDSEMNCEDLIVSTLITVSPKKVYIHTREPEMQVITTIRQIFEERAVLCTYCSLCEPFFGQAAVNHDQRSTCQPT